jgi:serine/threonine protein kinase
LAAAIPNASRDAIDFISSLLAMDPTKRPSARKALTLPFLQGESLKLSQLGQSSRAAEPELERPHAAPSLSSPRIQLSRTFSQESLEKFTRGPKRPIDPARPVDYRLFEIEPQASDDLFDEL